jgi:hypothetical protein
MASAHELHRTSNEVVELGWPRLADRVAGLGALFNVSGN